MSIVAAIIVIVEHEQYMANTLTYVNITKQHDEKERETGTVGHRVCSSSEN